MRIRAAMLLAATAFAVLAIPSSASAQRVAQVAITAPDSATTPLQVLDDYGMPILEVDIRNHMKSGIGRWLTQPLGFLSGALIMYAIVPKGDISHPCSQYDPCSDRQKYYRGSSLVVGGIVGLLVTNAVAPETSRAKAIEAIRAERRVHHQGRTQQ